LKRSWSWGTLISRFNDFSTTWPGRKSTIGSAGGLALPVHCEKGCALGVPAAGLSGNPAAGIYGRRRHREYYTHRMRAEGTVSCVQQVGILDNWRGAQTLQPNGGPRRSVQIASEDSPQTQRTQERRKKERNCETNRQRCYLAHWMRVPLTFARVKKIEHGHSQLR